MGATGVAARPAAVIGHGAGSDAVHLQVFFYLQLLDFMTTLIGMRLGLGEASPFIRYLMQVGPLAGLAVSKVIALTLCGICLWTNKRHLVRWINYWYAALVVWNMFLIAGVLRTG